MNKQNMAENKKENEIEKNFYKIKDNDKLTLTGKQLKEFAEYNRISKEKEVLKIINDTYYCPELDHKRVPEITIFIKELRKRLLKLRKKE